eukprot:315651_1
MSNILTVIYTFALFAINAQTIILTPDSTSSETPVGLIYLIGASISPSQYIPLCEAIQHAFPQPLYIGIPAFNRNMASLPKFVNLLPDLLQEMESKGLPKNSSIFMAGHSLGGSVVQSFSGIYQYNYTSIYPGWNYQGSILNAAVITRKWRDNNTQLVVNYSIPTLTLGGE